MRVWLHTDIEKQIEKFSSHTCHCTGDASRSKSLPHLLYMTRFLLRLLRLLPIFALLRVLLIFLVFLNFLVFLDFTVFLIFFDFLVLFLVDRLLKGRTEKSLLKDPTNGHNMQIRSH